MQALLAPALASMAVIVMLGPAAAQSSRSWAWCVNQGGTFSADQRINGCTSIIQSSRETRRNVAIAYYSRGLAYYDKRDFERAIASYNEAIRLDPKFAQGYNNRALVKTRYHLRATFRRRTSTRWNFRFTNLPVVRFPSASIRTKSSGASLARS